eukprot:scaffold160856_cov30-Tisochrysis_lutea.AAC.3
MASNIGLRAGAFAWEREPSLSGGLDMWKQQPLREVSPCTSPIGGGRPYSAKVMSMPCRCACDFFEGPDRVRSWPRSAGFGPEEGDGISETRALRTPPARALPSGWVRPRRAAAPRTWSVDIGAHDPRPKVGGSDEAASSAAIRVEHQIPRPDGGEVAHDEGELGVDGSPVSGWPAERRGQLVALVVLCDEIASADRHFAPKVEAPRPPAAEGVVSRALRGRSCIWLVAPPRRPHDLVLRTVVDEEDKHVLRVLHPHLASERDRAQHPVDECEALLVRQPAAEALHDNLKCDILRQVGLVLLVGRRRLKLTLELYKAVCTRPQLYNPAQEHRPGRKPAEPISPLWRVKGKEDQGGVWSLKVFEVVWREREVDGVGVSEGEELWQPE